MATKKITGIRGLNPVVFDEFKTLVTKIHGKSRGKHSLVALELENLMRFFILTEGNYRTSPEDAKANYELAKAEIKERVKDRNYEASPSEINEILVQHNITEPRKTRELLKYADDLQAIEFERRAIEELKIRGMYG